MKKIACFLYFLILSAALLAQNDVSVLSSGTAESEEHAIQLALRNAIEQAFGTFVSANTTILNDELVSDEIATITRGNIKSFDVLSTFSNENNITVNLSAFVSLDNLISYAKSKGSTAEYAGSAFYNNYKLMQFNAKNAEKALKIMVDQIEILHKDMFDYQLSLGEPYRIQGNAYNYCYRKKLGYGGSWYGDYEYAAIRDTTTYNGFSVPVYVDVKNNITSSTVSKLICSTLDALNIKKEHDKYYSAGIDCSYAKIIKDGDFNYEVEIPVSDSFLKKIKDQICSLIFCDLFSYRISSADNTQYFDWVQTTRKERSDYYRWISDDTDEHSAKEEVNKKCGSSTDKYWLRSSNSKLIFLSNYIKLDKNHDYSIFGGNIWYEPREDEFDLWAKMREYCNDGGSGLLLYHTVPLREMLLPETQREITPSPEEIRTIKKMKRKNPEYEYKPKYETIYGEPHVILSQQLNIYVPLQEMDTFNGLSINRK